jgi:CubicO group peptidase (beta-lactamase class C family)
VADAFVANFRDGGEVGAAVAIYVAGRKVVDLWGGHADRRTGRLWTKTTPALFFSLTKGLMTIATYLLVQDGRLELDSPVTRYWPEYGANGKHDTSVRMLLSHRAGVPALDRQFTLDEVLAWSPVIREIERQVPLWKPGTAHSYHPITFGWLIGELVRRVTGQSPGAFVREAISIPLGLDLWIGAPESVIREAAWLEPPLSEKGAVSTDDSTVPSHSFGPTFERAVTMGGAFGFPLEAGEVSFNNPRIQRAELPAANGIGTAESLARLFAACVSEVDGRRLLKQESLEDALIERSVGTEYLVPSSDINRWGTGFLLSSSPDRPMLSELSFGHDGAGGQLAFGDVSSLTGFAYINNQMGTYPDHRSRALTAAVRSCL